MWNQDDCVCVKGDAQNMLFERINASGFGLTIGSIGASLVKNITFRDCTQALVRIILRFTVPFIFFNEVLLIPRCVLPHEYVENVGNCAQTDQMCAKMSNISTISNNVEQATCTRRSKAST